MKAQAQAGEIEMAYLDEVGFAQVHPNRSAWTPVGQQHRINAPRGKRLNAVAALLSNGKVFAAKLWETFDSKVFVGFLSLLREHVGKPVTVVLDNASVHKAKAIQPCIELLKKAGVTLYFLPPYSPELNRIETLWRLMKHKWMGVKYREPETLEADVQHIFDNFGTTYCMKF